MEEEENPHHTDGGEWTESARARCSGFMAMWPWRRSWLFAFLRWKEAEAKGMQSGGGCGEMGRRASAGASYIPAARVPRGLKVSRERR